MIDWVHAELIAWGRWAARLEAGGLGYAHISPMFKERVSRPTQLLDASGYIDADHVQIDRCVADLPPILRLVCVTRYQHDLTARKGGEKLGCGATAYGRYLSDAHMQIAAALAEFRKIPH